MAAGCAAERYRQLLYPHGHGYPFWFPEPDDNLPPDQKSTGLRVGDLVNLTDDGGWEYLWNIHLPATHPQNALVPPYFAPVALDSTRDIRQLNKCFDKDTAITTTSVKKSEIKADAGFEPEAVGGLVGGAGGFEFTVQGNSGAILTLPRGGARINATKLNLYMQEACKNATSWYRHINGTLQRGMLNGALYLVTGTDKCSSWGVASFATSSESHGKKLTFKVSGAASASVSDSNSWTVDFGAEHRANVVDTNELSQCVFARGYTISLRDKLYLQTGGLGVKVTSPDGSDNRQPFFGSRRPYSRSTDLNRAPSNVRSTHGATTRDAPTESDGSPDADADVRVMRDSQPQKGVASLIGDELLKQNSDAIVAIIHDDDWIASTRSDDFRALDDSQSVNEYLVHLVLTHSSAVVVDGVCTLAGPDGMAPSGDTSLGRDPSMSMSGRPQPEPEGLGPARRADRPQTSGIHEDARQGTLDTEKLVAYLASGADVLEEKDRVGRTPLATAAAAGQVHVIDLLLTHGAKADALSGDGETPLLLAARDGAGGNRARSVQLLLTKTPADLVDATTARDKNTTPLMYAVRSGDLETVQELRKAGASLTAKDDDGLTAQNMAAENRDIVDAFYSECDPGTLATLASVVSSPSAHWKEWGVRKASELHRRWYDTDKTTHSEIEYAQMPSFETISHLVSDDPVLKHFFQHDVSSVRDVARNATKMGFREEFPELLVPQIANVMMFEQVISVDKPSDEGSWDTISRLVKGIVRTTTTYLPTTDVPTLFKKSGVYLDLPPLEFEFSVLVGKLNSIQVDDFLDSREHFKPGGFAWSTGNALRLRVLEPLVYSKIRSLKRPLLISVITSGPPSQETAKALAGVIEECGDRLQAAGYPRKSVKFVIFDTASYPAFANQEEADRWLIETLFSAVNRNEDSESQRVDVDMMEVD